MKWAGVGVLLMTTIFFWSLSVAELPEDATLIWAIRIASSVGFALALRATVRSPQDVNLEAKLRNVTDSMVGEHCPICRGELVSIQGAVRCPACNVERMALRTA